MLKYFLQCVGVCLLFHQSSSGKEVFSEVGFADSTSYSRVSAHLIISSNKNTFTDDLHLMEHVRELAFLTYNYFWSVKNSRMVRDKTFEMAI